MFVHTVEIKGNQNVLVTFYKILFCVQQKKVSHTGLEYESEEIITKFISSNFPAVLSQNQCFSSALPVDTIIVSIKTNTIPIITIKSNFIVVLGRVILFFSAAQLTV